MVTVLGSFLAIINTVTTVNDDWPITAVQRSLTVIKAFVTGEKLH